MRKTRILGMICAVFMAALLVMQFMPFWHYGDPEASASIQGFVWFPSENAALEKYIRTETENTAFSVGDIVGMPILELVLCAVGIVFCGWKGNAPLTGLLPAAAGAVGIWGYLAHAAFHLGGNWIVHLVLCAVLLALGAAMLWMNRMKNR